MRFPVALVGAAVLVPGLVLLYVYSVDVYEDTPIRVIALTMGWGAVWGAVSGFVTNALAGAGTVTGDAAARSRCSCSARSFRWSGWRS